jgi:uncharacterized protein (DUF2336 family)
MMSHEVRLAAASALPEVEEVPRLISRIGSEIEVSAQAGLADLR